MCTIRDAVKLGMSNQVIVLSQARRTPDETMMNTVQLFREETIPHLK